MESWTAARNHRGTRFIFRVPFDPSRVALSDLLQGCAGGFCHEMPGTRSEDLMDAERPAPPAATTMARPFGRSGEPREIDSHVLRLIEHMPAAVLLFEADQSVLYSNRAAKILAQVLSPDEGASPRTRLQDWHPRLVPPSALELCRARGMWSGEVALDSPYRAARVLLVKIHALGDYGGGPYGLSLRDITLEHDRELELNLRNSELEVALSRLSSAQEAVLKTEKLASIGQLAAGVAHEINNPIAYVKSNLNTLQHDIFQLLSEIRSRLRGQPMGEGYGIDIDEVATEIQELIAESCEGVDRVVKIVRDLKDFSHLDRIDNWVLADLHAGLESTLNIVWNELKYKAHIVKTFGDLPLIECLPSELNQVFMNMLMNAAQALENYGVITVTTERYGDRVRVSIGDDGKGIPEDVLPRIFDPFYTTKIVGEGTGLGLAISYGIVAKHHGTIEVTSVPGQGTLFLIELPIEQPRERGMES